MKNLMIKVGDYVRTDKGLIGKLIKKEEYDTHVILEYEGQYCKRVLSTTGTDSEVIKSSPNIIDLIEEKDIITYEYETSIGKIIEYNVTVLLSLLNELEENSNKYKIKSIITHEQIETMEYKIEN